VRTWQAPPQLAGDNLLVARVPEGEEQTHGDGFRVHFWNRLEVEPLDDAVRPHPLAHAVAAFERNERLGMGGAEPVQVGAVLPPQMEHVLEPGRRDEGRPRPLALEQCVGRNGRAVREALDLRRSQRESGGENRLFLAPQGPHLRRSQLTVSDQDRVRKRSPYVDSEHRHGATLGPRRVDRLGDMAGSIEIPLRGPGGEPVDLWRTIVSHGVASLPPADVDEEARVMTVTVPVPRGKPRTIRISQGPRRRARIDILGPRPGSRTEAGLRQVVAEILNLGENLAPLYEVAAADPELSWAVDGAGRMSRSPTVFEDVIKTICTTNTTWSATERMVGALVDNLGAPSVGGHGRAFPTPDVMASASDVFYRDVVRAGYRGAYLRTLATDVTAGAIDLEELRGAPAEALPDEEVEARLLALPGVGPYAAAHVMMLLGRHSRLILDSWTRPKYARLNGGRKAADRQIERRFKRYGPYAGLAFWLYLTRDWVKESPD
jgi:3-methyladenine DNA glycosylase/8-oxoguanine DNA glycosylase